MGPSTRAVVLAACALGVVAASCSKTTRARAVRNNDDVDWLLEPFKVRAGDDPSWSSPGVDDSGWQEVNSALPPGTAVDGWTGIAWFRTWTEVAPEAVGRPVPMYGAFAGATEVFVDGARAFAVGDPDGVAATGSTPVEYKAETPHWLAFSAPGRHLVAVRFASRHVEALQRIGFRGGFLLALGRPGGPTRAPALDDLLFTAPFIGAAFAFAMLHLLLFLFHRDRPANLHFALAALFVAGIACCGTAARWSTTATETVLLVGMLGASVNMSSVLLLRFYHAVFSPRLPRSYWLFVALGCFGAAASFVTPRAVPYGLAGLVAAAHLHVLATAVVKRASGAWVIAIGGGLWFAGGSLQMLGETGVIPFVPGAYLYGFLALLVSISIFLARDISRDKGVLARKLAEIRELSAKQSQTMERYRTVFETTGTGTILFADDAVITLANDEWSQLTGYPRSEIERQMTWMDFFSEKSVEKMKVYHQLRSKDPKAAPRTYEADLRDRRGRIHNGVVTINMVPGTKERVGSFLDLTDLKRAQLQMVRADKMAALGQIISGVAHEINNPNNFIHFNLPILRRYVEAMRPLLELQLEGNPDLKLLNMRYEVFIDDLFKLIENMEHGSARITAIVGDLKSYIRSGEDLEMSSAPIGAVVERVMALVGKQVQKMVRHFDVSVAEQLPPVRMNTGRIEQVLINLVINAGQAADKETSWVKLTARTADAGDAVEILVEDNGVGIPAESLVQIFEPFYTTKSRENGTGLGLSISQQIVEQHGGRIEVASEVGKGSCFTIRLPAARTG